MLFACVFRTFTFAAALMIAVSLLNAPHAAAQPSPERVDVLVSDELIEKLRSIVSEEIVVRSIRAQNAKYGAMSQAEIDALDQQWRAERKSDDKPLIAPTLYNPLSTYLTRRQATDLGLFAAIFVMDRNGLNVGQSDITGDYWQGDEAKFQKTFPVAPDAVFVDAPEWLEDFGVWIVQVNKSIADPETGEAIGAVTFDVNLSELARRDALNVVN